MRLSALLLLLCLVPAADAAVYKCIDAAGKASYQGQPCAQQGAREVVIEPRAEAAGGERWRELRKGILLDQRTQLRWTQRDNGADIDWPSAEAYCRELDLAGGGWSLPSTDELEAMLICAQRRCAMPALFRPSLPGPMLWSRVRVGADRSEFADVGVAALGHAAFHASARKRALCVRSPD
jgi:hypothetical protein